MDDSAPATTAAMLDAVHRIAERYVGAEGTLPERTEPASPPIDLRLSGRGRSFERVTADIERLLTRTPSAASPRFVNQLFAGRNLAAVAAEMLAVLPNTSMYTFKAAGPMVLVERELLRHLAGMAGWPGGGGLFTPGGSLANLVALVIARNEAVPGARESGLDGRELAVYTSAEGHYSIRKNSGILGIGRRNVRAVPVSSRGRLRPELLDSYLAEDRSRGVLPVMVTATAGTTVAGAFDPIADIADVCADHGVWLHVDGALGASALLSRQHRSLLNGCERADSITWDAHKMLGVPLSCSVLLLRRPQLATRHLNEAADYLFQMDEDLLNPGTRSLQCGRRNDALKLWAAWRWLGDEGWERHVDRVFGLAAAAAERIEADPALELLMPPESVCVCFRVRGCDSAAVCEQLDLESELKIGHGTVAGERAIRLVCVNPELDEAWIEQLLETVKSAACQLG